MVRTRRTNGVCTRDLDKQAFKAARSALIVMARNDVEQSVAAKGKIPLMVFFKDASLLFKMDALGSEILRIAFPAALALAADPIASLIDTAFIGRLGAVELAAVGVSIAIFNQASKVTIFPLVSITTSFVAEEDTIGRLEKQMQLDEMVKVKAEDIHLDNLEKGGSATKMETQEVKAENTTLSVVETSASETSATLSGVATSASETSASKPQNVECRDFNKIQTKAKKHQSTDSKTTVARVKRHIPSASTALVMGAVLGILQTIFLISLAKPLLGIMGVKSDSPMLEPAERYLKLRSLGAPAVLLSLAMQGVFRGFKDTTTPLYATVAGDLANVVLDPILIFVLNMGVSGAAIAHVLSQYLILVILFYKLMKQVYLLPPSLKSLQFSRFLKNGFYLLGRVIAATSCVTLAASLAARLGTIPMAAFQICLQVWMTSSLLADGLAVAGQAIIACAFAEKDYQKATAAASRVLQMAFVLGLGLSLVVGLGLQFGSVVFTKDNHVLHLITIGVPFVAATQPINSLAFVFDGVNYGVSDFAYSAYSMVLVALASITSLFLLSKSNGFVGIWLALTIYMSLRALAGVWRMGTGTGPWRFLRDL
ncbi:protein DETOXIFICATION 43 isoform X1 [Daucus carota subsp. sativus]|uniref:protein DETOXIFICATION 43 isoform X1 n=2 Tax=Daucus carota subsp. sativus TaxID=79200 RepID=UPI0007EF6881|nr:PREDICTED: protein DETOXIFICATION 43-like isoform X1 [Daucus carota subsp. sativus]